MYIFIRAELTNARNDGQRDTPRFGPAAMLTGMRTGNDSTCIDSGSLGSCRERFSTETVKTRVRRLVVYEYRGLYGQRAGPALAKIVHQEKSNLAASKKKKKKNYLLF
jgi:hypothetical protein